MEQTSIRAKIQGQIQHMMRHTIIKDRRFLDDEQLIRAEQLAVLAAPGSHGSLDRSSQ